jgi:hypothetical protein
MAYTVALPDGRTVEFPDDLPKDKAAAIIRQQFPTLGAPQTTMLGGAKELFKGLVPGAVGLVESAATGASALLPEDMEKAARAKIASVAGAAKAPFAAAPGYEESTPRKLSEAIGSTVPFLAAGPFGLAGRAAAVGLGVGAGAGEARTRAEQAGATAEQRSTATGLGVIPGALEAFAPLRILSRIPTASKAAGVETVKRALIAGGEEAAQEAASGFAQNLIAKGVYKPEQELIEGLGEQAAYGGATGAIVQGLMDLALGRRVRGAQTPPAAQPGPQLPADAAPGTQGTMFTPDEMGAPVDAPAAPAEPPTAGVPAGQEDLGLDFQREYADMAQERERLKQQAQTPEVKARVAELTEQMALYTQSDIESMRAEREAAAARAQADADARARFPALAEAPDLMTQPDEVKARTQGELFPGEDLGAAPAPGAPIPEPTLRGGKEKAPLQYKLPLRAVREGREPKRELQIPAMPGALTMQNILDTGVPLRVGMGKWFEDNVVGKTIPELQALAKRQPELVKGQAPRAKILRELLAPQPAKFEETPSVPPTPTPQPAPESRPEPGPSEPSMGVPSEPVPEPAPAGDGATGAPVASDGVGLAPAGQPAVSGNEAQGAKPTAVEVETAEAEAARKAEAADLQRRLDALEKAKPAAKAVARAAAPAPKAVDAAPKEIPEKLREPVGITDFGGDDTILRGPQGMLFPMTKREEAGYAKAKEAEDAVADEPPAGVAKDDRQAELDFTVAPATEEPRQPSWADERATGSQVVVYADEEVALVRALDGLQTPRYYGMDRRGYMVTTPIESITNERVFTADQQRKLRAEAKKAAAEDTANAGKYPDGPFTGTTKSVIGSDSIAAEYVQYLSSLMQSLGLGNIRVFMYTDVDVQGSKNTEKYKLYGDSFPKLQRFRASDTQGAVRPLNAAENQYGMFIRPGRSERYTLETISHEMGHIIEHHMLDLADAPTRQALRTEYEAWLEKAKKMDVKEFMYSLRNREDVASQEALLEGATGQKAATDLPGFASYWASYAEWFADNVSRWATTNAKPLTITEKFFSKVAQKMRDLVTLVTGRTYPPNKVLADFLNKMGPADFTPSENQNRGLTDKEDFSVSVSTESLIDSMGPMEAQDKSGVRKLIDGFKTQDGVNYATKFRTQTADAAATIEHRLRERFDGAVRDSLGKLNPMGLYRQAQDHAKVLLEYFQRGSLVKDPTTGLWGAGAAPNVRPPAEVYALIDQWAAKNGYSRERGTQLASRILEGVRLDAMRTSNKVDGTDFALHLKDPEIDQLVREYKADPDLQAMSKLMDEARLAMVDNMVAVGRLSPEQGKAWKDAAGYVPFDRIEDFAEKFSKIKKISNKGLAQVGKLPELVGSLERPVGNVFDNYLNTLGWMVGQTMKTDATVRTLRSLEDVGHAKYLGRSSLDKANAVGMYVKGEMMYWELPSKYDVLAFKDLNPPKAGWLRALGQFSNVLRKSVTVLPPFALKQVTDDVQRAIMTSGVKNPGALLRMALTNFPKLALAELRGIQHPVVREFGALGLTGEYDFEAGKPATSLLKDLGYKPRGKFETLLHRLDGVTRASDLAIRKAIYDQTLKESNNDRLLAQTRAREFINFRRRGASDFVGAMVTTIPFFNAYIQGMDVLYRAASGKDSSSSVDRAHARRMFWSRAATVMVLSSMYALGKGDDDEEYNEMDLRTRDGNWILPGGYKIPVPGELGALFKVIPERVVEFMKRQGTPEEQTAWEATRTALSYIYEQYLGRATPVPQAVKPLIEAWSNKSFLTGRELEGIYQKQQDPSQRRGPATSELAIAIAEFSRDSVGVEVSPIMIDNTLRGYFGSTAALLTATTDSLLNPTRVDRPLHKWALLSNYMYDPVGTRRMTEFYEEREKVGRANVTLNELMKTDMDRAAAYAEAHADELMLESAINSTLEQLERTRAYRKFLNSPDGAQAMPADEREAALKEVKQMEIGMTGWLREAKTAIRSQ